MTPAQNTDDRTSPHAAHASDCPVSVFLIPYIPQAPCSCQVHLRFVLPSHRLAALQINPLLVANLGASEFWLAVHRAK